MDRTHDSAPTPESPLSAQERELGMGVDITRRDFLNAVALGTGAALLGAPSPKSRAPSDPWHPWTGYGGVGDYARSNGNTWDVVTAGHGIRDSAYEKQIAGATSTGEHYDLVIVGGGFAGVMAAYTVLEATHRHVSILMLDNHPIIGGEAKRNEFLVRGQRLMGPQGSNQMALFAADGGATWWKDIGLPTDFEFGTLPPDRRPMEFPLDNYLYQLWADRFENHGYFFEEPTPRWVSNPWGHDLAGTPWPAEVRRDLLRWRRESAAPFAGDDTRLREWLDSMTYDEYLTKVRGFHPEVARFVDPIVASAFGLGSDAISAWLASYDFPGFQGLSSRRDARGLDTPGNRLSANVSGGREIFSFPGGNDGVMRALVKSLNPDAIEGTASFADVHNGRIRFEALDRPNIPCRMRAGATVVRLLHDPDTPGSSATITYTRDGTLSSITARTVIWAAACWSGKHAVVRLPDAYRAAMDRFPRSPMLVVNVALDNWRALYQLGYTACSWRGGFGYTGNLRAPMYVGDYRPPLDPDQPTLFTLYVPFNQYGLSLVEQGKAGRAKLYATTYRDYEAQIRRQLTMMFSSAGFDPARDIAGIVLNRWGHAYVNAGPGFFTNRDGQPSPGDVLRRPLGNVTFAHSELGGAQTAPAAWAEGRRAAQQVLDMLSTL